MSADRSQRGLRLVGWGRIPLPWTRRRLQEAEEFAQELIAEAIARNAQTEDTQEEESPDSVRWSPGRERPKNDSDATSAGPELRTQSVDAMLRPAPSNTVLQALRAALTDDALGHSDPSDPTDLVARFNARRAEIATGRELESPTRRQIRALESLRAFRPRINTDLYSSLYHVHISPEVAHPESSTDEPESETRDAPRPYQE